MEMNNTLGLASLEYPELSPPKNAESITNKNFGATLHVMRSMLEKSKF